MIYLRYVHKQIRLKVYSLPSLFVFVIFLAANKPKLAPINCAAINAITDSGEIPTTELVKIRPMVIAGLANEVLEVNNIAPKIQSGTYIAIKSSRFGKRKIIQSKIAVAKISEKKRFEPVRSIDD